jgi:hypothetical protein
LTNGVSPTGTITFKAYAPKSDGTADSACGTLVFTSVVSVNAGNGDYPSANFTPSGAAPQIAGSYNWTAAYSGDANNVPISTACGDTGETSLVKKSPTRTDTTEALKITEKIKVTLTATGTSNVQATGPTRIRLFKGTCVTGSEDTGTANTLFDETHTLNNNAFDVTLDITSPGDFYWFVEYKGDSNTDPSNDDCTETFSVHFPVI